jgi:hypothetical protein
MIMLRCDSVTNSGGYEMAKSPAERQADKRRRNKQEDIQLNVWISASAKTALDQLVKRDSVTQRVALENLLLSSMQIVTQSRNIMIGQPTKRDSVTQTADIKTRAENLISANSKDLTRQLIDLYGGKKQASAGIKELDGYTVTKKSLKPEHSERARLLATLQQRVLVSTYKLATNQ